jgi:hypothetical protein
MHAQRRRVRRRRPRRLDWLARQERRVLLDLKWAAPLSFGALVLMALVPEELTLANIMFAAFGLPCRARRHFIDLPPDDVLV